MPSCHAALGRRADLSSWRVAMQPLTPWWIVGQKVMVVVWEFPPSTTSSSPATSLMFHITLHLNFTLFFPRLKTILSSETWFVFIVSLLSAQHFLVEPNWRCRSSNCGSSEQCSCRDAGDRQTDTYEDEHVDYLHEEKVACWHTAMNEWDSDNGQLSAECVKWNKVTKAAFLSKYTFKNPLNQLLTHRLELQATIQNFNFSDQSNSGEVVIMGCLIRLRLACLSMNDEFHKLCPRSDVIVYKQQWRPCDPTRSRNTHRNQISSSWRLQSD